MELFRYCIRFPENQLGVLGLPLKEKKKQQKEENNYSFYRSQDILRQGKAVKLTRLSLERGEDIDGTCYFIFIFLYFAQSVDMCQWLQPRQISK